MNLILSANYTHFLQLPFKRDVVSWQSKRSKCERNLSGGADFLTPSMSGVVRRWSAITGLGSMPPPAKTAATCFSEVLRPAELGCWKDIIILVWLKPVDVISTVRDVISFLNSKKLWHIPSRSTEHNCYHPPPLLKKHDCDLSARRIYVVPY